jgi:hypothetical protein
MNDFEALKNKIKRFVELSELRAEWLAKELCNLENSKDLDLANQYAMKRWLSITEYDKLKQELGL